MRVAEHDGKRYLLRKQSGDSSLLKDPETGKKRYVPNDELTVIGASPLSVAAESIPEPQRRVLTAVHSETVLGLLVELDECGPLSVREILDRYDLCESDLHGQVTELRAAGLLEEATVNGERGYATTALAEDGLSALR